MKKCILSLLVLVCVFSLVSCSKTYNSTEALIDKVREEIPIAEADTIEIQYAGMTAKDNTALLWYISGNEYQKHTYFPIECEIKGEAEYKFVRSFHIVIDDTGMYDEVIKDTCYPYVFCTEGMPSKYIPLDAEGNELG